MMNVNDKIIAILNQDTRARILLESFNDAVERQGLTADEASEARKTLIMLLISRNPEAMDVMARDIYESFQEATV